MPPDELVQRPFAFAVIDEADSILIDEARIPLVIAGGVPDDPALAYRVDRVARTSPRPHYSPDEFARNVQLTDAGIQRVESARLRKPVRRAQPALLTAVQDALHAHALLQRDVDYVVKNGAVELVDEFKGRIAQNRRWPAGLQSAIEAKERVRAEDAGAHPGLDHRAEPGRHVRADLRHDRYRRDASRASSGSSTSCR